MNVPPRACLLAPALVAVIATLGLVLLAQGGWPGTTGTNAIVFCESLRDGLVKQPVNTLSNAGFTAVGLWIGWRARREFLAREAGEQDDEAEQGAPGRMASNPLYPTIYAAIAAFLGPASAALHASTTSWGGRLDVFGMYLWSAFAISFAVTRLFDLRAPGFIACFAFFVAFLGRYLLIVPQPISSDLTFGVTIALFVLLEWRVNRTRRDLKADWRYMAAAAVLFAVAFLIWLPSRTDGPLCDPDSWLQGHAVWHLLNAGSIGALYLFYRSEREVPAVTPLPAVEAAAA